MNQQVFFLALFVVLQLNAISVLGQNTKHWGILPDYMPSYTTGKPFVYNDTAYILPDQSSSFIPGRSHFMNFAHKLINESSFDWEVVEIGGDEPLLSDRYCTAQNNNEIFMYGGLVNSSILIGDGYILDARTLTWRQVGHNQKIMPPRVYGHLCFFYKSEFYVYGGVNSQAQTTFLMWKYTPATTRWTYIQYTTTYPNLMFGSIAIYKDTLYQYGGCDDIECYSSIWLFVFDTFSWKKGSFAKHPVFGIPPTSGYAVFTTINSKLYLYAPSSYPPPGLISRPEIIVLDLDNLRLEAYVSYGAIGSINPKVVPSPRAYGSLVLFKNRIFYISSTGEGFFDSSQWFLDPVSLNWTSSLIAYPYDRNIPYMVASDSYVTMFGGQSYFGNAPLDEVWLYSLKRQNWEMASATYDKSILSASPNLGSALYFNYNDTFYMIGGFSNIYNKISYARFSLETRKWSSFVLTPSFLGEPGNMYATTFVLNGNKIFISNPKFNDYNVPWTYPSNVFIIKLDSMSWEMIVPTNPISYIYNERAFAYNDTFCIYGGFQNQKYVYKIQCFDVGSKTWYQLKSISQSCPSMGSPQLVYLKYIFLFGSPDTSMPGNNAIFLYDFDTTQCVPIPSDNGIMSWYIGAGSTALVGNQWMFLGVLGYMPNLSNLNTNYLMTYSISFCNAMIEIDASKQPQLSDGSGKYYIIPGTNCAWRVLNANFLVVQNLSISRSARLLINVTSDCMKDWLQYDPSDTILSDTFLSSSDTGSVFRIQDSGFYIQLTVPVNDFESKGFSFSFYNCPKGFDWNDRCTCPMNHYINFRGECIKCPNGTSQALPDQKMCEVVDTGDDYYIPTSTNSLPFGAYPPSTYLGNSITVNDTLYVFGGLKTIDNSNEFWNPLDHIYISTDEGLGKWRRFRTSGDDPIPVYGGCLVNNQNELTLIGGMSPSGIADRMQVLDITSFSWQLQSVPFSLYGHACTVYQNVIYVHGGIQDNNTVSSSTWFYSNGRWKHVQLLESPATSFSATFLYLSKWIFVSGWDGHAELSTISSLSLETMTWVLVDLVSDESCGSIPPDSIRRQKSQYLSKGSKGYIYGGLNGQASLSDLILLDFDTLTWNVVESDMLKTDTSVFHTPPPKYGGLGTNFRNRFFLSSGFASTSECFGNDIWVLDLDTLTYNVGVNVYSPLFRQGNGIVRVSDSEFLIFGGQSCRPSTSFLNDVWKYNIDTKKWALLSPDSVAKSVPQQRSHMGVLYSNKSIFVLGGICDNPTSDHIWTFSLDNLEWEPFITANDLSPAQNLFLRYDFAIAVDEGVAWIWGGQVPSSLSIYEDFSTVFRVSLSEKRIVGIGTINGPVCFNFDDNLIKHSIAFGSKLLSSYGFIYQKRFCIFGGVTSGGKVSSNVNCFGPGFFSWDTAVTVDYPQGLSNFAWVPSTNNAIVHGGITSNGDTSDKYWYFDYEHYQWLPLVSEYQANLQGHTGVLFGEDIVLFGGANGVALQDIVIRQKPGFCSFDPPLDIIGGGKMDYFGDGSGPVGYNIGRSCRWVVTNSTFIQFSYNLTRGDSLYVEKTVSNAGMGSVTSLQGQGTTDVMSNPSGGFIITLSSTSRAKAIRGQQGFTAKHIVCPKIASFDVVNGCRCRSRHYYDYRKISCEPCGPDSTEIECQKDDDSTSLSISAIIGISVSVGVFLVGTIMYLVYLSRKKNRLEEKARTLHIAIGADDVKLLELLGSGSFGEVHKGIWRDTEVAVKKLYNQEALNQHMQEFSNEISLLVELRHPNIVLYMAACMSPPNLCIVTELMKRGSLYDFLHNNVDISLKHKLGFVRDVVKGMNYLHSARTPVIHRDLKSPNLLLDENLTLKISAKGIQKGEWEGSFAWLAPEVLTSGKYSLKSDVFSFAIILWEIMTQKYPYEDLEGRYAIIPFVSQQQKRMNIPENIPHQFQNLIQKCWKQIPEDRPSFDDIQKELESIIDDDFIQFLGAVKNITDRYANSERNGAAVTIRVENSVDLWEASASAMERSLIILSDFIRKTSDKNDGRKIHSEGDEHVVIFLLSQHAILFALEIQELANLVEWPSDLLAATSDLEDRQGLFRGPRIKIGIANGSVPVAEFYEEKWKAKDNDVVDISSKLCNLAYGGQILLIRDGHMDIQETNPELRELGNPYVKHYDMDLPVEGKLKSQNIYEIYPRNLSERAIYLSNKRSSTNTSNQTADGETNKYQTPEALSNQTTSTPNKSQDQTSNETDSSPSPHLPSRRTKLPAITKPPRIDPIHNPPVLGRLIHTEKNRATMSSPMKLSCEIDFENLAVKDEKIGVGSYGAVYVGTYKGEQVAIKKMHQQTSEEKYYLAFLAEVATMQFAKFHHPNLLRLVGAATKIPNLAIVTEYVELGDLRKLLTSSSVKFDNDMRIRIVEGIASGMGHLHRMHPPIIHRDLKTSNVLISSNYSPKICDFGFARTKAKNQIMTRCGTLAYEAPEILMGKVYTESVDVYSFAIVIWEIITHAIPYQNMEASTIIEYVVSGKRPKVPKGPPLLVNTMTRCWDQDAAKRPTFDQLIDLKQFHAADSGSNPPA